MICPYYKNKDVFNGFNEIVEALGGRPLTEEEFRSSELRNLREGTDYAAMEAAYRMYHLNNGNMLDRAPNGARSNLFQQLLTFFNGNRTEAIVAKSLIYSDDFLKWFGDWINSEFNNTDENGEPLIQNVPKVKDGSISFSHQVYRGATAFEIHHDIQTDLYVDLDFINLRISQLEKHIKDETISKKLLDELERLWAKNKADEIRSYLGRLIEKRYESTNNRLNFEEAILAFNKKYEKFLTLTMHTNVGYLKYIKGVGEVFSYLDAAADVRIKTLTELRKLAYKDPGSKLFRLGELYRQLDEAKKEKERKEKEIADHKNMTANEIFSRFRDFEDDLFNGTIVNKSTLTDLGRTNASTAGVKLDEDYQRAIINHLENDKISYGEMDRKVLINLAKALFDYFNKNDFKIRVVARPYSLEELRAKSSAVSIHEKYATIYYVKQETQESPFLTLLHELLHIATNNAMPFDAEGRYIKDELLLDYYRTFVANLNKDPEYRKYKYKITNAKSYEELNSIPAKYRALYHAEESVGEFISSFINEKSVRDFVNNISYDDTKSLFDYLRENLLEFLRKIFKGNSKIFTKDVLESVIDFLLNYEYLPTDENFMDLTYKKYYLRHLLELQLDYDNAVSYNSLYSQLNNSSANNTLKLSTADQEMQEIKDKAIADGTFMKAPNGKPTNLNERQWLQVRTKAFINWFGDWINDPANASKVVDENGEPLVVYHGTKSTFNTVDFKNSRDGVGFYAAGSTNTADTYGLGSMYSLFLNIKNPYVVEGIGKMWNDLLLNDDAYTEEELKNPRKLKRLTTNDISKYAKEHGYDGVIFKDIIDQGQYSGIVNEKESLRLEQLFENSSEDKSYANSQYWEFMESLETDVVVALDSPNQIKSATDNNGEFSTEDDNIYHGLIAGVDNEDLELFVENNDGELRTIASKKQYQAPQTMSSDITTTDDIMDSQQLSSSITQEIYNIGEQIDQRRNDYTDRVVQLYQDNNPNASQELISRVLNNARKQFDIELSNQIMKEKQQILSNIFGLHMNSKGYFESSEFGLKKLMLEYFINCLQKDTFSAYNLENLGRDKYQQVGTVLNATSVANVIYHALYSGDLATLDKRLARDYIRMFWGSDLIQSALDSLNDGHKTSQQLEDELVNRMTIDPVSSRNLTLIDWFRNIWNQLSDLIKTVFDPNHNFTEQDKNNIIKAAQVAYMLSEDLEYTNTNNVLYDRADGNFLSSQLLSEKDKQVLSNIKQGLKARLKSLLSRSVQKPKLIADLKSRLEVIEGKNEDSIYDVFDIIQDFLIKASDEISRTRYYIDRTLLIGNASNMENWNPQELNFIQLDLIGYYKNLLQTVVDLFTDNLSSINKFNEIRANEDPNAINIKSLANQLARDIDSLLNDYNHRVIKPYVRKVLTDFVNENDTIKNKQLFIYNMEHWLDQDSAYGDLAAGEVLIGMASRSKSSVVRIVEKMISEAELESSRLTLQKGNELMRLYNKVRPIGSQISPYNWQKRFMEFDKDGISTGYFIREINYGQFYKDKDEKEQQLREKYNLQCDEDGNTIFPEEDYTRPNSVYNKYYDELDEWLDKHCERRYKLAYYKARRRFLSPETIKLQEYLQRQINLILDKCYTEDGFVDKSRLTHSEKLQLDTLRKQKRDLGSHYIFTETSGGILHVEEKTGIALKVADEISAWNNYIKDKVKYKPDWTKFNQAKLKIIDRYGANSLQVLDFEKDNTSIRITSLFYELLHEVVGKGKTNDELEKLKRRYSEIINALKIREGAGSHNLRRLGLGINTDRSGWEELHRIEERMARIKLELNESSQEGEVIETTREFGSFAKSTLSFDDIAKMLYVTVGDNSNQTFLSYLVQLWRDASLNNADLTNVFNLLFTYRDAKGKLRYLKAFLYLTPSDWTITVDGGEIIRCIEKLPGSEYSELDESSAFVNENFVKGGKSLQAKAYDENRKRLYKSEEFEKLNDDEKEFLQALLDTKKEADEMIPKRSADLDEMLPQVSGRTLSVLANTTLRGKELMTGIKYTFRKFGVDYSETTDDVSTNMDLARRPDGSVVNNIPIRFVDRLKNPAVLSTDVLGSVIMFYDMACNYSKKSEKLPTLELIKVAITPELQNPNKMQDLFEKVENILDQRVYGKETSFGFDSNEKITPSKQKTILSVKTVINLAAVAMLGINFTTIEVGYIDAMCSMLADAIAGKYLTMEDYRLAFRECIKHTPTVLKGLGNPVVDDKLVAAMQYNQLSMSNSEIFSMTDKFKIGKFIHNHLLMGGYTLSDYMINGMFLRATYNHYRLILDPKTGENKFFSKSMAINEFTKLGYTEKLAIKMWEQAKVTLWDAYELKNGLFVLKDQYKDIVTTKLINQISGRLRDRTAMYNGVVPMTEKAKLQQNVFGSFITLMRNFYVNTYWDRFKTGGDYVTEDGDHHITWRSEYQRDDLGMENLETGEFEGAVFKDWARGIYKLISNVKRLILNQDANKLTSEQKYAVVRCTSELFMIGSLLYAMLWTVAFARENDYDDDKEPSWKINLVGKGPVVELNPNNREKKFLNWMRWKLALLATRAFTERLTSWWAPTVVELFTSPSTATSYLDDVGRMWDFIADMFTQRSDEEIKSGGYKHMTRGTRDILKLFSFTGLDNLVRSWHTSGIKATFNYYRKLKPTNTIIPSQEEWNKQHGKGAHGGEKKSKESSNKQIKYI